MGVRLTAHWNACEHHSSEQNGGSIGSEHCVYSALSYGYLCLDCCVFRRLIRFFAAYIDGHQCRYILLHIIQLPKGAAVHLTTSPRTLARLEIATKPEHPEHAVFSSLFKGADWIAITHPAQWAAPAAPPAHGVQSGCVPTCHRSPYTVSEC